MGIFPKKLLEVMQVYCEQGEEGEEITGTVKKAQIIVLAALRELWINRCKKVYAKSDEEVAREKQQQREKRKSTSSKRTQRVEYQRKDK